MGVLGQSCRKRLVNAAPLTQLDGQQLLSSHVSVITRHRPAISANHTT